MDSGPPTRAPRVRSFPAGGPLLPQLPRKQIFGGKGWVGRVGGGYDHQFNARIVAGVFADFDFSSLEGTIQDGFFNQSAVIKQRWSGAAGARVGWLATPNILTYVNAGFSRARFSSGTMVFDAITLGPPPAGAPVGFVTPAFSLNGWFIGGGIETAIGSGWFWRNEYRMAYYADHRIPDLNASAPTPTPRFNDINFKPWVQTFTTQIVYKFDSGQRPVPSAPPSATVASRWTGLYVDGGVGYGL
jgi:outer membrane immunogenic protein